MNSVDGAHQLTRQHSTAEHEQAVGLAFTYRLATDTAAPLIVMIHGRAGTRDVMWLFERALPKSATIVSFQAPDREPVAALGGFSWWDIQNPGAARIEGPKAAHLIAGALLRFESLFSLSPSHRIAIGFSQGAAVLSSLVLEDVLECDGVALLAGFVVADTERAALGESVSIKRKTPVYIGHGTTDDVIPVGRAIQGKEYLEERGHPVTFVTDPVGHKLGVSATRGLTAWVNTLLGM